MFPFTEDELQHNPDAVSLKGIEELFNRSSAAMQVGREQMLKPNAEKQVPHFGYSDLEYVTKLDSERMRKRIAYWAKKGADMPVGYIRDANGNLILASEATGDKNRRKIIFPPQELRKIIRHLYPEWSRPDGIDGFVIGICNFKGGVSKSTTTLTLAQAMSLRGMRVLIVDLDPQATSTKWQTVVHIKEEHTCLDLFKNRSGDIKEKILPTYWPGIDLIPAHDALQKAEFYFTQTLKEGGHEQLYFFPRELRKLTAEYDLIVIDTPPSLNNLTLSALFASDGLVMPLPPSNPDLESAANFWRMYRDTLQQLDVDPQETIFQFVKVMITKVENNKSSQNMIEWMEKSYGPMLAKTKIAKSAAISSAADSFGTVYDVALGGAAKSRHGRDAARNLYDDFAAEIAEKIYLYWARQKYQQEKNQSN